MKQLCRENNPFSMVSGVICFFEGMNNKKNWLHLQKPSKIRLLFIKSFKQIRLKAFEFLRIY